MNPEPITEKNTAEANEFLARTGGKTITAGWTGFLVRDDEGRVWGVFQHCAIRVANFHVDPEQRYVWTARFMLFCQNFVRAVFPGTLTMCDRKSPLYDPAVKSGMVDVTEKTAYLKLEK